MDSANSKSASSSKFFLGCSLFGSTLLMLTSIPSTTFSSFLTAGFVVAVVVFAVFTLLVISESSPLPNPFFFAVAMF